MTTTFTIRTLIELMVSGLLIYGFMHENKVIAFEQAVKRIVLGHIRRAIRIHNHKKAVAKGKHLYLYRTNEPHDTVKFKERA